MLSLLHDHPDVPLPIKPPGEGRETGSFVAEQTQQPASFQGGTGIGTPQQPTSATVTRAARVTFHEYAHDQSGGMLLENDGGHVAVGMSPGIPNGDQEPGVGSPQRPTFRTPPETWTAPLTDDTHEERS